jgi:tetratricopeptide (TPR) repeat protein
LSHLGTLRARTGDLEAAEELQRRALEMHEAATGPDHPGVAASLRSLGNTLTQRAAYEEAETCFRRALDIFRDRLGADHPLVAEVLEDLAGLCTVTGRQDEARELAEQAGRIRQTNRGT